MKKIKESLKKGGIADIVTLVIIVGLAIGLVLVVVMPMIKSSEDQVKDVRDDFNQAGKAGEVLVNKYLDSDGNIQNISSIN